MKISSLVLGVILAFSLTGCVKLYKNVKTDEHAKYQMLTKGDDFSWNDSYYVNIYDYSKGCSDIVELGLISAGFGSETKVAKIPVEIPLYFKVTFIKNIGRNQYFDITSFVLTPEQGKNYVVEYERNDGKGKYYVYMKNGDKVMDIPSSRIKDFSIKDCK